MDKVICFFYIFPLNDINLYKMFKETLHNDVGESNGIMNKNVVSESSRIF